MAPPRSDVSFPMIAFWTVFDSVSSTTKSNGLSWARMRLPVRRSRKTSSRYTIAGPHHLLHERDGMRGAVRRAEVDRG